MGGFLRRTRADKTAAVKVVLFSVSDALSAHADAQESKADLCAKGDLDRIMAQKARANDPVYLAGRADGMRDAAVYVRAKADLISGNS